MADVTTGRSLAEKFGRDVGARSGDGMTVKAEAVRGGNVRVCASRTSRMEKEGQVLCMFSSIRRIEYRRSGFLCS